MPMSRHARAALLLAALAAPTRPAEAQGLRASVRIASLPWTDAAALLDTGTVVLLPMGAEAKEHGPHLPLDNDYRLAQWFTAAVAARTPVAIYPTVNYGFYPAFVDYPGSTTLALATARDVVVDVVRTIARHGPRRFYVLNTGVSTLRALAPAQALLALDGITMTYTDILAAGQPVEDRIRQQEGGTHADELETSLMLYMHPEVVRMERAQRDYHPGAGGLTPDSARAARRDEVWSRTGIFGDATLATRAKGEALATAMVDHMVREVEALRRRPIAPPR